MSDDKPYVSRVDGREFHSCVGEHISEGFIRGYADKIRPINSKIADDLLNIAEHSNRLALENHELRRLHERR